jgi:hypothetical protein
MKAHRVVGRRGSYILWTVGSQVAVRLSALRADRPPFTSRKIAGTHFCYKLSRPQEVKESLSFLLQLLAYVWIAVSQLLLYYCVVELEDLGAARRVRNVA